MKTKFSRELAFCVTLFLAGMAISGCVSNGQSDQSTLQSARPSPTPSISVSDLKITVLDDSSERQTNFTVEDVDIKIR